jgi:hypothetical protein
MNVLTNSLRKLRQKRKVDEPQLPGSQRISLHYCVAKDTEIKRGKVWIFPTVSKRSFLDPAANRVARTISQI